jgi:hypothetical protein
MVDITGAVNVLFVSTSVVLQPTNVSVEDGSVNVPLFVMVDITGAVNVLFVNVCVADKVTTVSVVSGKVIVLLVVCTPANVKVDPVVAPLD